MRYILFPLLLCFGVTFGQTKMIAHKSHSGTPLEFNPVGQGNFGLVEPPPHLDSVVTINDSTVVQYMNDPFGSYYYDTIVNNKSWMNV